MRRAILERFRAEHGDKRIAKLERRHVEDILGRLKPFAAKNWLKTLRGLLKYAVVARHRGNDPTEGIQTAKPRKSDGFLTWSEDQIAQYRRHHPFGTRARLALELLTGAGQARGDTVRMGRQHVREGVLKIRRGKTNVLVEMPVLPEVQEALDAMPPAEHLTFLTTEAGKSFTAAGFGNWFCDRCREAGLPKKYAAHGLRKAAATRHADHGATAHELMAWFGWTSIREAERYTKAADRKRLALGMVTKLRSRTTSGKPS
jgi:site-specific recombinase XerD